MLHTRRECIKDMLNSAGFVNVQELVNRFQVSSETIRRDLEYLEKEGVLKRIHGGAVSVRPHANESAYHTRQQEHTSEKQAIARAAAELGMCDQGTATRIMWLLERFGLPIVSPYGAGALSDAALSDKKRSGDRVTLVLPEKIGRCALHPTPVSELEAVMQAGL